MQTNKARLPAGSGDFLNIGVNLMTVRISKLTLLAMFTLGLTLLTGTASASPTGEARIFNQGRNFGDSGDTQVGPVPVTASAAGDCVQFEALQVHLEGETTVGATTTNAYLFADRRGGACTSSGGYYTDTFTEWEVTDLIFASSTGGGGTATVDLNFSASGINSGCNFVIYAQVGTGAGTATNYAPVGGFSIQGTVPGRTVALDTPQRVRWGFNSARCGVPGPKDCCGARELTVDLTGGHGSGIFTVTSGDVVSISSVMGGIEDNQFAPSQVPSGGPHSWLATMVLLGGFGAYGMRRVVNRRHRN
jgi:hypothetical protein